MQHSYNSPVAIQATYLFSVLLLGVGQQRVNRIESERKSVKVSRIPADSNSTEYLDKKENYQAILRMCSCNKSPIG